jgi:hypothetical protein
VSILVVYLYTKKLQFVALYRKKSHPTYRAVPCKPHLKRIYIFIYTYSYVCRYIYTHTQIHLHTHDINKSISIVTYSMLYGRFHECIHMSYSLHNENLSQNEFKLFVLLFCLLVRSSILTLFLDLNFRHVKKTNNLSAGFILIFLFFSFLS